MPFNVSRDVLRAHAKLARLVLQDVDLDDARRLHPVEQDMIEVRIGAHNAGELLREDSRTLAMSGPLSRYCTGRPTGGPTSSSLTKVSVPGKVFLR